MIRITSPPSPLLICVDDEQCDGRVDPSDRLPADFALDDLIDGSKPERISKNAGSDLKANPMFPQVSFCFPGIPLEPGCHGNNVTTRALLRQRKLKIRRTLLFVQSYLVVRLAPSAHVIA